MKPPAADTETASPYDRTALDTPPSLHESSLRDSLSLTLEEKERAYFAAEREEEEELPMSLLFGATEDPTHQLVGEFFAEVERQASTREHERRARARAMETEDSRGQEGRGWGALWGSPHDRQFCPSEQGGPSEETSGAGGATSAEPSSSSAVPQSSSSSRRGLEEGGAGMSPNIDEEDDGSPKAGREGCLSAATMWRSLTGVPCLGRGGASK